MRCSVSKPRERLAFDTTRESVRSKQHAKEMRLERSNYVLIGLYRIATFRMRVAVLVLRRATAEAAATCSHDRCGATICSTDESDVQAPNGDPFRRRQMTHRQARQLHP
jgi:hypothetical protein